MTREEFYKLTDILDSEVLGNFMHGGEADELIAMFEEAVEHSNILEQEEPVSEDLVKVDVPQEDTEEWLYNNIMINAPDVLNPLYQCFFITEKATDKRWVYSRRRADVNSDWGEWKKYLYDYE